MERYQLGKIYKITSEHTDKIYIGSTCKKLLCERLAAHSSRFKQWKEGKVGYTSSYELFELGSVQINLLEAYPCDTKDELLSKERYYIEKYKDSIVNKYIPIRTNDEKKEYNIEHCKKYHEENKEHANETSKKYYEANKEKYKNYYEANRECISGMKKNYYEVNKEKILENLKKKDICLCGSEINISSKKRHEKTIKHLKYINELPKEMPTPETS
jgi:site-specific DNA-adenine methylase